MFFLCLFVLFYYVGVCDSNSEIYRVGNRVVRLSEFIGRIWICVEAVDSTVSGLLFEVLIISTLLLFSSGSLLLLGFRYVDLVSGDLAVVVELFLSFP